MENIEGCNLSAVRNSLPSSQLGSRSRDYLDSRLQVCLGRGMPWGHLDIVSVSLLKIVFIAAPGGLTVSGA
jgi:hypothetical protein